MLTAAITSRSMRRVGSFGRLIPRPRAGVPPRGPVLGRGYDRPVVPLLLVLFGVVALVAGAGLLRRLGPRGRIGRILAATQVVEVGRAVALAAAGRARYVGVGGRLDAEEPWEDESGRPLVFRRSALERRDGSDWVPFEEDRRAVPFEVSGAVERIAVDADALDEGLVVVTRESVGRAADLPDRVPPGTPAETPVRLRVEFLSAVDHALVLGVPTMTPAGPVMRPGLGRPLIVTTLEPAEAMRLLAEGRQGMTRAITGLLAGGLAAIAIGVVWAIGDAAA